MHASKRASAKGLQARRVFAYVAIAMFAAQLFCDLPATDMIDADTLSTFAVPANTKQPVVAGIEGAEVKYLTQSASSYLSGRDTAPGRGSGRAKMQATAAGVNIGQRVLNAMGAGAVASVIQAALSAVGEPIVNRVLVKRMKVMDAVRDVSPAMMLDFFKTTLATNFLKFPFFEAINAFCACLPIPPTVRGFITGFVFTSATLPVTNYRYRKSMQLEVKVADLYEAYVPTVIRDIVYGIVRNYCTIFTLKLVPEWKIQDPQVLFIVVILGCLGSAPFNEWRGYLLQTKGQKIPFDEFFKPANFVRSTSLGALKQGLALAAGYWCTPPVSKFVHGLMGK
jgi:hypothetical protein